jgi:hypothetical protein
MKSNLPYLLWAYALIAIILVGYAADLVRRMRRVVAELDTLAAAIRDRRGEGRSA